MSDDGYRVTFIVDGRKVTKVFQSYYNAWKFVNKAKHSRKLTLVSYPSFAE